ncbi:hypothetical protein As57867_021682, partial [Aphanomyces stellatus]
MLTRTSDAGCSEALALGLDLLHKVGRSKHSSIKYMAGARRQSHSQQRTDDVGDEGRDDAEVSLAWRQGGTRGNEEESDLAFVIGPLQGRDVKGWRAGEETPDGAVACVSAEFAERLFQHVLDAL